MDKQELKGGHYIVGNLKYDTEGAMLFDENNNIIADIRGYGRVGSSGQDQIGELLAKTWNTRTPSLDAVLDEIYQKACTQLHSKGMYENQSLISLGSLKEIIEEKRVEV